MSDDSAYRKILRLIGRGRDSPNNNCNNNNEEPEDEYGSVPEHLRGELERKNEYLIDNSANLFKELVKFTHGKNNSFTIFSLKELQKATNNFSADSIWYKYMGTYTYRGIIGGRRVSIKIHIPLVMRIEVVSLSMMKHRNVVKLVGCCLETKFPILVHELLPNGKLRQHMLYEEPLLVELSWTDRLRIATEIADALAYLHSELQMTHGSLYSTEAILLDEFHSAKLGGFHNSRIENQTEGTDVEINIINKVRKHEDVRHFGNLLLDLLSIQREGRRKFTKFKEKVEILKYLLLNVSEKEMPQIEAYIDLLLRCRSCHEQRWGALTIDECYTLMKEVGEVELSMKEFVRELRRISMMNHQPTTDGNESDNLSSGAN